MLKRRIKKGFVQSAPVRLRTTVYGIANSESRLSRVRGRRRGCRHTRRQIRECPDGPGCDSPVPVRFAYPIAGSGAEALYVRQGGDAYPARRPAAGYDNARNGPCGFSASSKTRETAPCGFSASFKTRETAPCEFSASFKTRETALAENSQEPKHAKRPLRKIRKGRFARAAGRWEMHFKGDHRD